MLFEIHDGYLHRTSITFNYNTHVVRTCSCSFRLSRSTALQVMASTLDYPQLLDYTWAGMRHHLKSTMGVDLRRAYVKYNLVREMERLKDSLTTVMQWSHNGLDHTISTVVKHGSLEIFFDTYSVLKYMNVHAQVEKL